MTDGLTLVAIEQARQRIAPYVRRTPILPPPALQSELPQGLMLKLENLQLTGSFKVRGVFNSLLQMSPDQQARGVMAASGGNHGVALAYGAHVLGIPCIIYLPAGASSDRVARITRWGARVIQHGAAWDDAHARGLADASAAGATYIHPFAAVSTIQGQATLGLDLLDQVPEIDCVVVAIGGGGLIGGMAVALKQRRPDLQVIGVEPEGAASMLRSRDAGHVVELPAVRTIAETLAPRSVSELTLALAQRYVDQLVTVSDLQMIEAMRWLWQEANQLVEPAGAAAIAALLDRPNLVGGRRRPVALICGGNADAEPVFAAYRERLG